MALHQVGEIEEQLAAARREVTKSEEANQKLQREVKEVCGSTCMDVYYSCTVNLTNVYEVNNCICCKGKCPAHLIFCFL